MSPGQLSAAALVAASLLAVGCASLATSSTQQAEAIVMQRSQARWNALVERDFAAAYKFLSPSYREVVSQRRYANQFSGPVSWESAKAKEAKCEEKRCTVQVQVDVRTALPRFEKQLISTHFDEVWVLEEGEWYKFEAL